MLRITMERTPRGDATLRVEGRLVGRWVDEVAHLYAEIRRNAPVAGLDLTGVSFVDRDAIELLRRLQRQGLALSGCSSFLREQIKGSPDVESRMD